MTSIFADLLPANDVTPDDDFFALGGHSLQAARLIHRVHEATGSRIQVRSLFEAPTPRALAALVGSQPVGERRSEASIDPSVRASAEGHVTPKPTARGPIPGSIVPIRPGGTHGPLFVVPGVGSRILFLRHLARHLGPDVPLYALHADRLEDGSIYRRIEDLAARYARDLRHVQPSGPYRLLGFSLGGLVAFEVAQVLRAAGDEVEFLGIVDTRLPQQADQRAWSVLRSVPRRLMNLGAILQPLSGPARRSYLRTRLLVARQNGIAHLVGSFRERFPRGLFGWAPEHPFGPDEPEWLAADQAAWGRYRARPYPGKVVYFWAQHSQRPPDVRDNREGWAALALGGLEVRPIPGSHLTVLLEPLVRSSARAIRAELLVRR